MRIAILGAPGSGKGAQAKLLSERYRVPRISVGDLLRDAAAADGKLDGKTRKAVEAGRPVAGEIVMALLEERLRARDSKRGFIIDGFPQNIPRAQAFDTLLGMFGWALQVALHIKVDDETLVQSITGRMRCSECDAAYNRHFSPPKTRGKCDHCGEKVVSENSGNAKAAALRIEKYHEQTTPLLAYYKAQHKLRTVVAEDGVEETRQKICGIVDLEIRPLEIKTIETAAQTLDEEIRTVIAGGQISRVVSAPETLVRKPAATAPPVSTAGAAAVKKTAQKTAGKKSPTKRPTKKTAKKKSAKKKTAKKK